MHACHATRAHVRCEFESPTREKVKDLVHVHILAKVVQTRLKLVAPVLCKHVGSSTERFSLLEHAAAVSDACKRCRARESAHAAADNHRVKHSTALGR